MVNYGFLRIAAASPKIEVANPEYNAGEIIKHIKSAKKEGASIICFPELALTGYTCADLFLQDTLIDAAEAGLSRIAKATEGITAIVGIPVKARGTLFNAAAVVADGAILGVVPKVYIPNYSEYYEKRWFASGYDMPEHITLCGKYVPASLNMLFEMVTPEGSINFGIEICEDLWAPEPPSAALAKMGCDIIFNPSASTELVTKHAYRRALISQQSGRLMCTYVYAGAGRSESTTDVVFSGYTGIFENGAAIAEGERFCDEQMISADTDIGRLRFLRGRNTTFFKDFYDAAATVGYDYKPAKIAELKRYITHHPFVPSGDEKISRLKEITAIQTSALIKRLEHINVKNVALGISGGVDSALCLLVAYRAFTERGWDTKGITAITMPGFGTTGRTKNNAVDLVRELHCTLREIDITQATNDHFSDIGHDGKTLDVTYENAQARERTQIIMDVANMEGGIALGTGDMSELALGWCTYNADQMSMYNVNCSIPKTLIKSLAGYMADEIGGSVRDITYDILDTPISPELLPADGEKILQKTEDVLGKYDLHDFFLYHMLEGGASPKKLYFMAKKAFAGIADGDEILKALKVFISRFFSQQFKRSCMPDGPKVGTVALSPRGDLRMPSDASAKIWLAEIDEIR
jgi:NAD+ synthase (glutamine-hydrolysing)